ncbi:MAG: hypothetical protein QW183_04765 [Saccharolobus sp.]
MIENLEIENLDYNTIFPYITKPFFFVGSLGHVGILRVYDNSVNNYLIPNEAKLPDYTKFHVAYMFGKNRAWIKLGGGVKTKEGFLNGPVYSSLGISYKGSILNEETEFEINLSAINPLKIRILYRVNEKLGVWSKITGFNFSELVEHMVKAHLIPALTNIKKDISSH